MQKKKGISLIVLVITIIVMIILAAAIIISLNNSGIIGKANKAVNDTNEQEVNHIAQLAWSEAYLNGEKTEPELRAAVIRALENNGIDISKYVITVTTKGVTVKDKSKGWIQDGLNITKGNVTLEAGDLIQYNAGVSSYTGAWKVLGAEDGNLLIMSTEDVENLLLVDIEGGTIYDKSSNYGLFNALDRLEEICAPYGNGIGAVGSRNIKAQDINKLTLFDPNTYEKDSISEYNNKVTFSWGSPEGRVNYSGSNGISGSIVIWGEQYVIYNNGFTYIDFNTKKRINVPVNNSNMPTLTNNFYYYHVSWTNIQTDSPKASEMIFGTENDSLYSNRYYLDEYVTVINSNQTYFGIRGIEDGRMSEFAIQNTKNVDGSYSYAEAGVRAVVKLSPNIKIGAKDNTLGWSYTI